MKRRNLPLLRSGRQARAIEQPLGRLYTRISRHEPARELDVPIPVFAACGGRVETTPPGET
jgi:hypothetical protein